MRPACRRRKRGKKAPRAGSRGRAGRYGACSYSFWRDRPEASLVSTDGWLRLRVVIPPSFQAMPDQASEVGSAGLVFHPHAGDYWLHLVVTLSDPEVAGSVAAPVVAVDVGISRVAGCSDNRLFPGKWVKETARRMARLRRALQANGTRSATRQLRPLRERENRRRANVNHSAGRRLLEMLRPGSVIVMENLTGIRERVRAQRARRRAIHNRSSVQLQAFVACKAEARGIQVGFADPRYSSPVCSCCGHFAPPNRRCRSWFSCGKCGYQSNADLTLPVTWL